MSAYQVPVDSRHDCYVPTSELGNMAYAASSSYPFDLDNYRSVNGINGRVPSVINLIPKLKHTDVSFWDYYY